MTVRKTLKGETDKMRKKVSKTNKRWAALLTATTLVFGLAGFAAAHPSVRLYNGAGLPISELQGTGNDAFSSAVSCGRCHTYANIEKHSYHVQLSANQFLGWDIWNPDSSNSYKYGPAPKGKNWVQSPGHFGKW